MLIGSIASGTAAAALLLLATGAYAQALPMLDGESSTPANVRTTYDIKCSSSEAGGMYRLVLSRDGAGAVQVAELVGHGNSVSADEVGRIKLALARFAYVDNVTPRCLPGGGAKLLIGGGDRHEGTGTTTRAAVAVEVSPTGGVKVEP